MNFQSLLMIDISAYILPVKLFEYLPNVKTVSNAVDICEYMNVFKELF